MAPCDRDDGTRGDAVRGPLQGVRYGGPGAVDHGHVLHVKREPCARDQLPGSVRVREHEPGREPDHPVRVGCCAQRAQQPAQHGADPAGVRRGSLRGAYRHRRHVVGGDDVDVPHLLGLPVGDHRTRPCRGCGAAPEHLRARVRQQRYWRHVYESDRRPDQHRRPRPATPERVCGTVREHRCPRSGRHDLRHRWPVDSAHVGQRDQRGRREHPVIDPTAYEDHLRSVARLADREVGPGPRDRYVLGDTRPEQHCVRRRSVDGDRLRPGLDQQRQRRRAPRPAGPVVDEHSTGPIRERDRSQRAHPRCHGHRDGRCSRRRVGDGWARGAGQLFRVGSHRQLLRERVG
ncbi:unannotated protein [freshwater metagenome]|uniref:Unannotated protein n=1 Tax=freshwater metagenome TaxID=449393 RepID=A0A6J7CQC7_9ZZZZ